MYTNLINRMIKVIIYFMIEIHAKSKCTAWVVMTLETAAVGVRLAQ